ncbi:MAG: antibiotic biosynthesis monooxygenase [Chloroflexi bacterium]|nr:antibiotic biosynthesis monooxygenase [Chloroflexota bacterium]
MAVKVFVRRVPRPGAWRQMNEALRELRMLAMRQPGYISSETLLSATDQGTTMVISVWASINHWNDYAALPQRMALLDKLRPLLEEPAAMEIWVESPVIG